jgi:photosystem II stability/assembly factor-like uncharacterized protein
MWIDPANPDVLVVPALGHTYSPNAEPGIFKTIDGGQTWRKVLFTDEQTGGIDVVFSAENLKIGYATLMHYMVKPGQGRDLANGAGGGGIFKTADGGHTWKRLDSHDLPTQGR